MKIILWIFYLPFFVFKCILAVLGALIVLIFGFFVSISDASDGSEILSEGLSNIWNWVCDNPL